MPVTAIKLVINNSGSPAVVQNLETPSDTASLGSLMPGANAPVEMWVPWCADGVDFEHRHIAVDVGAMHFVIWQAKHDDGDSVRVALDGKWHMPGPMIGAFAGVEWLPLLGDRILVINDGTLWLLPIQLQGAFSPSAFQLCGPTRDREISAVPRVHAAAFSMAGHPSEAFHQGRPGARFLYRDSGRAYKFTLGQGVVSFDPPAHIGINDTVSTITQAISFRERRTGHVSPAPPFELIAANGGRVFAKERGVDRFFFASVDDGYIHAFPDSVEFVVPSSSLTLDAEFNKTGASLEELVAPTQTDPQAFGHHPAAERWPAYRLAFRLQITEAMLVLVRRLTWHLLDTRPPHGGSAELSKQLRNLMTNETLRNLAPFVGWAMGIDVGSLGSLPSIPPIRRSGGTGSPGWVPIYDHVTYCGPKGETEIRRSIAYTRVLDIGVGHVHHHEQYEGITGGEVQPFFIGQSEPWLFNAAEQYRFMFGPIRDGDGYIDGTCNYYLLVQLADDSRIESAVTSPDARGDAYALLWIDEQSYFTERWHVAHPDDHEGVMISIVERLNTDPVRYQWNPATFWCPFRAGFVGPRSRSAVAAQVVLVTGEDPDTRTPLLLSINFSFGTIDRTWRWRRFPAPAHYFDGDSLWIPPITSVTGEEEVPDGEEPCVYPQTLRLRGDMTICVGGRGMAPDGHVESGVWYQRYLPATNDLVPPASELRPTAEADLTPELLSRFGLTPPARPHIGYSHPWKFLPRAVFDAADRFSHFGVYAGCRKMNSAVGPASTSTSWLDFS